jgi:hypothetical protein
MPKPIQTHQLCAKRRIIQMKNMALNKWMMLEWLPRDMMAEKYTVGQDLTTEQANEIIRIIAHSVGFNLNLPQARKNLDRVGTPYRDFITCMVLLILAGKSNIRWAEILWNTMDAGLQHACNTVMVAKVMGR